MLLGRYCEIGCMRGLGRWEGMWGGGWVEILMVVGIEVGMGGGM